MLEPMPTADEMLDFLEAFVNEHGALVLHTGGISTHGIPGLGLRPGHLNRTLREAIVACMGAKRPEICPSANRRARQVPEKRDGALKTPEMGFVLEERKDA